LLVFNVSCTDRIVLAHSSILSSFIFSNVGEDFGGFVRWTYTAANLALQKLAINAG